MGALSLLLALALPAGLAGPGGVAPSEDALYAAWRPLLASAIAAGCGDDPRDLYKLVHQGTLGPAHAVPADGSAVAWLQREWREAAADSAGQGGSAWPLFEPLRPDSQLVRVHLAPLAALVTRGVPAADQARILAAAWEQLAGAFAGTAGTWPRAPDLLRAVWTRAAADTALWAAWPGASAVGAFTGDVARAGWPAVHHSEAFVRCRRPHYRVVSRALLPPAWLAAAGWSAP